MGEDPRRRVIVAARSSDGPVTAAAIAALLRLHVTTARYHLDRLVDDGLAARATAPGSGRAGRPSVTYSLVDSAAARTELVTVLAGLVDRGEGREGAQAAGEAWADSLPAPAGGARRAIEREFAARGFSPQPTETGLDLHDCPFWDAALAAPGVICGLHLGLTRRLAERADGRGTWSVELEPFVGTRRCAVTLTHMGSAA